MHLIECIQTAETFAANISTIGALSTEHDMSYAADDATAPHHNFFFPKINQRYDYNKCEETHADITPLLRRTPASVGFPLIRACVRRLQHPSRQLQWVRSNPERSRVPRTAWDQSQWEIFIADWYARTPASPPLC